MSDSGVCSRWRYDLRTLVDPEVFGYRTPRGRRFYISHVGKILRDETYIGTSWYNKFDSRAKKDRPREEWIAMRIPPIISEKDFQRTATQLSARNPKKTAPRIVNSPAFLTSLARCGGCGGFLRRATGKGGRCLYYQCAGKVTQGSREGGKTARRPCKNGSSALSSRASLLAMTRS